MNQTLEQELYHHLSLLPLAQQHQVLDFARRLSVDQPQGVQGGTLLRFAGTIPTEDLIQMQTAIETECEHVNTHDW